MQLRLTKDDETLATFILFVLLSFPIDCIMDYIQGWAKEKKDCVNIRMWPNGIDQTYNGCPVCELKKAEKNSSLSKFLKHYFESILLIEEQKKFLIFSLSAIYALYLINARNFPFIPEQLINRTTQRIENGEAPLADDMHIHSKLAGIDYFSFFGPFFKAADANSVTADTWVYILAIIDLFIEAMEEDDALGKINMINSCNEYLGIN